MLEDHYTGAEINAAVARGGGFDDAFPGETDERDLDALRELFQRKALLARQARLCAALLAGGASAETVVALRVSELPGSDEAARCLELRARPRAPARPRRSGARGRRRDAARRPPICQRGCAGRGS